jgi:hypothetical protein
MNKLRPYMASIAAALGISMPTKSLPFHLPFLTKVPKVGRYKRSRKSMVNRASSKCNEINPKTDKKRGHLNDILKTYKDDTARVCCRRCGKISVTNIRWPEREAKIAAA